MSTLLAFSAAISAGCTSSGGYVSGLGADGSISEIQGPDGGGAGTGGQVGQAGAPAGGGGSAGSAGGGVVVGGSGGRVGSGGLTGGGSVVGGGGTLGSGGRVGSGGVGGIIGSGGVPINNCGNGRIDTGEDCEGANLNGATCTSLGFMGGTLSCAASCVYNSGSCTGPITPVVTFSRSTCAAPCAVFFDGTATTGLAGGDYVAANFDWDFDSTNINPSGTHRKTIGAAVAHVFEAPGSYQVSVRVRDTAGNSGSKTFPITVSAMSGTTYYVASSGKDSNNGTSMSTPFLTPAHGLSLAGTNTSVLLRRGDTFSVAEFAKINVTGPFLLGAYSDPASPSSKAPLLNTSASMSGYVSQFVIGANASDIRVVDLHVVSPNGAFSALQTTKGATNTLVLRMEASGFGYTSNGSTNGEIIYAAGGTSGHYIVDSNFHDFLGYGQYSDAATQIAIIGTSITNFAGGDHGARFQGGNLTYVAENTCAALSTNPPFTCFTFRGDNDKIVFIRNVANLDCGFAPQNTDQHERQQHILAEGNYIRDQRPDSAQIHYALTVKGPHATIRNNIFQDIIWGVVVSQDPNNTTMDGANWVTDVKIYNNTQHYPASSTSGQPIFLTHNTTTGTVVVQNNIFYSGSSAARFINADGLGTETENHNLTYAPNVGSFARPNGTGDIYGNPMFMSATPGSATDFALQSGSPAKDAGTTLPAYLDYAGTNRPQGATFDLGSFEYIGAASAP